MVFICNNKTNCTMYRKIIYYNIMYILVKFTHTLPRIFMSSANLSRI